MTDREEPEPTASIAPMDAAPELYGPADTTGPATADRTTRGA
ncbi:hypothetical protein [Natronomonas sp. EA1]